MMKLQINSHLIGDREPVWIIAEIGGNFTDFPTAKKLIDLAMASGVDSIKLQTYRAETISSRFAMYDMENTGNANQYDLFKKYEIDFDLHKDIWQYCNDKNITIFSTPSHITDIEMLEKLDCPVYKIGSDDAVNHPFLKEVAMTGKPVILSTGMSTLHEVRESVSTILGSGNDNLALLHCVTSYPAHTEDLNLRCIQTMKNDFGLPVGYSDHTQGTVCAIAAATLGADIIEKHFTYDKNAVGPDHILSASPEEMLEIVDAIRLIENAMGDGVKRPAKGEITTRVNNRKSIVATREIKAGSFFSIENIAIKRPGFGIEPKYFKQIIGRKANQDIPAETVLCWDQI